MRESKREWQRRQRAEFAAKNGFSTTADYGCGGLRQAVLERDCYKCVCCGMTDEEHKAKWNRPITIDHKNKNRTHNTMDNLQTLCLTCHGRKDITASLTVRKVEKHKEAILSMRGQGITYQSIADDLHFSIAAIWKWCKQWEMESHGN